MLVSINFENKRKKYLAFFFSVCLIVLFVCLMSAAVAVGTVLLAGMLGLIM